MSDTIPAVSIPIYIIRQKAEYYRLMQKQYLDERNDTLGDWCDGHAKAFEWILEQYLR